MARKDQYLAFQRSNPSTHTIRACCYLQQRFTARTTVFEQTPTGMLGTNIYRAPILVIPVVLFHQIGVGLCGRTKSCQLGSLQCPLQRTGEYFGEAQIFQARPQFLSGVSAPLD